MSTGETQNETSTQNDTSLNPPIPDRKSRSEDSLTEHGKRAVGRSILTKFFTLNKTSNSPADSSSYLHKGDRKELRSFLGLNGQAELADLYSPNLHGLLAVESEINGTVGQSVKFWALIEDWLSIATPLLIVSSLLLLTNLILLAMLSRLKTQ